MKTNSLRTNDYIDDLISNINKIKNKNNYEKINIMYQVDLKIGKTSNKISGCVLEN